MSELNDTIRAILKSSTGAKTTIKPLGPQNGTGVQKAKVRPLEVSEEYGRRGDFSRSNSNPTSRPIRNSASVELEEVTRARLSRSYEQNKENKGNKSTSLNAEFETILKVVRIALDSTGGAPSKRAVKRMATPKMTRSDRVFKTTGPGSSKSPELDAIKAIAAKETGCIVRKETISESKSMKNANTTQGGYFPQIVE